MVSEKLQHSVMKFDRGNKFDFCYYGQVNTFNLLAMVLFQKVPCLKDLFFTKHNQNYVPICGFICRNYLLNKINENG